MIELFCKNLGVLRSSSCFGSSSLIKVPVVYGEKGGNLPLVVGEEYQVRLVTKYQGLSYRIPVYDFGSEKDSLRVANFITSTSFGFTPESFRVEQRLWVGVGLEVFYRGIKRGELSQIAHRCNNPRYGLVMQTCYHSGCHNLYGMDFSVLDRVANEGVGTHPLWA